MARTIGLSEVSFARGLLIGMVDKMVIRYELEMEEITTEYKYRFGIDDKRTTEKIVRDIISRVQNSFNVEIEELDNIEDEILNDMEQSVNQPTSECPDRTIPKGVNNV